ncbi:hypothetical protein [Corynebacterium tapiri]|uniref:Type VI secretion system lipoprotein TssJ n=1 Tax=Corynebacterium tapiri TaxID=1448266 RepID=A0A5C4U2I5_9CORY|nr:hypothetical protein [Corynebacterium tapiri]TNL96774.1 hypothetical protein FHE74_07055 [Corynebacterium tapiri]
MKIRRPLATATSILGCLVSLSALTACGNLLNVDSVGSSALTQDSQGNVFLLVNACGRGVTKINAELGSNSSENGWQELDQQEFDTPKRGKFTVDLPQLSEALKQPRNEDLYIRVTVDVNKRPHEYLKVLGQAYLAGPALPADMFQEAKPGSLMKGYSPESPGKPSDSFVTQEDIDTCRV